MCKKVRNVHLNNYIQLSIYLQLSNLSQDKLWLFTHVLGSKWGWSCGQNGAKEVDDNFFLVRFSRKESVHKFPWNDNEFEEVLCVKISWQRAMSIEVKSVIQRGMRWGWKEILIMPQDKTEWLCSMLHLAILANYSSHWEYSYAWCSWVRKMLEARWSISKSQVQDSVQKLIILWVTSSSHDSRLVGIVEIFTSIVEVVAKKKRTNGCLAKVNINFLEKTIKLWTVSELEDAPIIYAWTVP